MKKDIFSSIRIVLTFCVVLSLGYVLVLWIFAKCAGPAKGAPEKVMYEGRVVGAANVGQTFTDSVYFWGRPSAVDYDASSSGGSNYGPTDSVYLSIVEARIDNFLLAHPYLDRSEVPSEMVTASGSGLDPDISPEAARVQVLRVAKARGVSADSVEAILSKHVEEPLLGPAKVNVLKLNVELDNVFKNDIVE